MAYNLLKGKRGIIFGALNDASIAWKVAERASEEGAQIVLTNTPVACRMGTIDELAKKTNATIIPADATSVDDLEKLFVQAQEVMGGKIDFVLHSVAMSVNMRKKRTYDDLDYGFLNKTLDISAISFHKMIQTAKKLDAINENGSILALSYVAAQRTFFGYNDMADAKSLLESIARSFGYIYGREKGVRVNTISQSPTFTTAGGGIKQRGHHAERLSGGSHCLCLQRGCLLRRDYARCAGKRAAGAAGSRVLRGHELVADHAPHRAAAGAAHRRACAVQLPHRHDQGHLSGLQHHGSGAVHGRPARRRPHLHLPAHLL